MSGQTVILSTPHQRRLAHDLIDRAPEGASVNIREKRRTGSQNDLMWAMLSDISRQCDLGGQRRRPDVWKVAFMRLCGHEMECIEGLDGRPFLVDPRSSRLTVQQMSDLITVICQWGDENGVQWSNEP